jgi:hypothetical protein
MNEFFEFILNPLEVVCQTPFEVLSGYLLRRANEGEVKLIKQLLTSIGAGDFMYSFYETAWTANTGGHSGRPMAKTDWRYWIFQICDPTKVNEDLGIALHLMEPSLELGFGVTWNPAAPESGCGWTCQRSSAFNYFDPGSHSPTAVRTVDTEYWNKVKARVESFVAVKSLHPNLWATIQNFSASRTLPRLSPMSNLAMFGTIEALITHKPAATFESLNHQVSSKMALIGKLFSVPLDYSSFPSNDSKERVWKKLYAYRSNIAHGGTAELAENQLSFLYAAVRRLIAHAIENPEFMADLQKC